MQITTLFLPRLEGRPTSQTTYCLPASSLFHGIAPILFQLNCDWRCHSHRVPMGRIREDGVNRDIFGDRRVVRVSNGTTPAVDAFFSNKRGAER
jgi:hypothetical protein